MKIFKKLSEEEGQFDSISAEIPQQIMQFPTIKIGEYDNEELKKLSEKIADFNTEIDTLNSRYVELTRLIHDEYQLRRNNWEMGKSKYDSQLKESLRAMKGIQDKSSQEIVEDYMNLIKENEKCKPLRERRVKWDSEKEKLLDIRTDLIEEYKEACDERDAKLKSSVKKINKKKLKGKVRISILPRQNKKALIDYLKENIRGVGDKSLACIDECDNFDVFAFADDCREGKDKLKNKYGLTSSVAEKIVKSLDESDLRTIEEIRLEDIVEIELKVNEQFKQLKELSKGQQCTAILNLLLLDNKDPLIVDQPEDNLDNSFIADNLVSTLRENKIKRQYILATHNANIPVFGDAEQIITLEEVEGNGRIANGGIGSIDDSRVRDKVISILEGGRNAFKMREEKYGIK